MNVLYISDDRYALLLGISLTSLYDNNKECDRLDVYIVDDGIGKENRQKLLRTADKYNRRLYFIAKPDMPDLIGCTPDTLKWCDNVFCRLFSPTLFAKYPEIKKILYLDCDTVVADDLRELWSMDLKDHVCAAGLECMGNLHKKIIGMSKNDMYVNSGVMLIDIKKWKERRIENKCRQFLKRYKKRLEYVDESIINGVLKGNMAIFHPRFNLTTIKCVFSLKELKCYRKSTVMYEKEEYEEARCKPGIIHYTANFLIRRPFVSGHKDSHPCEEIFLKYKEMSEWEDSRLLEEKTGKIKKLLRKMTAGRLRHIVIWGCGIVYCYGKPLRYMRL